MKEIRKLYWFSRQMLVLLCCTLAVLDVFPQPVAKTFVPSYKAVFNKPPTNIPTSRPPDAPVSGNGDLGIVLGGTPDKLCVYMGKNDFWKSKSSYPEGGLCLPGGVNMFIPELEGASYYAEQVLANGTINATFRKEGLTVYLKLTVPATTNIVIAEMSVSGKPVTVNLHAWAKQGFESTVDSGRIGGIEYAQRHFDLPVLDWPSHVAIAINTIGAKGNSFILKPSAKVIVAAGICTNHENGNYLNTAIARVKNISTTTVKAYAQKNTAWWKQFWNKSYINIGDSLLEKYYYGSQYLLACCSRNKVFPPGICGNTITDDATNTWEGDYHLNYNYQATWWGSYSSNRIELTEGYDRPILDYMPKAKRHAKEELNIKGVYYPTGIGPKGFTATVFPVTEEKMAARYGTKQSGLVGKTMFRGQQSNALFLTANMLLRFYTTYDRSYAQKIYPFLQEVDNFWQDYLQFENGYYNSYNDNFWETGPGNPKWKEDMKSGDSNNTATLGLLKMFYKGLLDVSNFLGVDKNKAAKWNHIKDNLYPLALLKYGNVTRLIATERGTGPGSIKRTNPGFGRLMGYTWVFPAGIAGVKTDSSFATILRKEVGRWDTEPGGDAGWRNTGNGFEGNFTVAVRVGYDPVTILEKLKKRIIQGTLPNLWVPQAGGFTETLSGVPSCINEMLLQGYEGMIRVFPAWPGAVASFDKLRTHGAFVVSSQKKNDVVQYVKIVSEKGRDCMVENPWPGKAVNVSYNGKKINTVTSGSTFSFKTKPGGVYMITVKKVG